MVFLHYSGTDLSTSSPASSIVAKSAKAARTSSRHYPSAFLDDRAAQAGRKIGTAPISRHLPSILDHTTRLRRCILYLKSALAGRVSVVGIRQIHNCDLTRIVAPKECWSFVKPLAQERSWGWDDGHFRQAGELRLCICLIKLAPVRKIGGRIRGVVIHKNDTDSASRLNKGEKGIVLIRFATVDEGKFCLAADEAGVGVLIEGVGINCVLIHKR